ncbi:hypothetical protein L2E82_49096 [Cichorium intybus]|uniref:Uncharacterized protein n=1 Tax=Cichorium intybus TaxID=13427 RepID=A0ACB8YYQ9_CICIN|nr:hypothetical protein L2E82_49096 [Cichorium intybus]
MEYRFGAHDYSISGVFEVEPKSCPGFTYRCSVSLGGKFQTDVLCVAQAEKDSERYNSCHLKSTAWSPGGLTILENEIQLRVFRKIMIRR